MRETNSCRGRCVACGSCRHSSNRYRARIVDYRIIYTFDLERIRFICLRLGIAEKFIATSEEYNNFSGCGRSTYGFNCRLLKINRF